MMVDMLVELKEFYLGKVLVGLLENTKVEGME